MRKVNVFDNVVVEERCLNNDYKTKWARKFLYCGWFHGIATEGEAEEELYPVAIVELEDGNLITPTVNLIQFIEKPKTETNKNLKDWAKTTASNRHLLGGS